MKLIVEFLGLSRRLAQVRESLLKAKEMDSSRNVMLYLVFPRIVLPDICPLGVRSRIGLCPGIGNRHVGKTWGISKRNEQQQLLNFMEAGG